MMKNETLEEKIQRAKRIIRILRKRYPAVKSALHHSSALEILIATILSAQCTDKQVNIVTRELFRQYESVIDYANADIIDLEKIIKSTGFYRAKAKNIIACCRVISEKHGGNVPDTMEELVGLPGVGRKTSNVVLGNYFGKAVGIVVDTHVKRISARLDFTREENPEKIEYDLMQIIQKRYWIETGNILIRHGRETCRARKPKCLLCPINGDCPSMQV